jgi:hypothetical protein
LPTGAVVAVTDTGDAVRGLLSPSEAAVVLLARAGMLALAAYRFALPDDVG